MTDLHLDHIEVSDALTYLKTLPDACVNLCVTSPPYFGLRDYGTASWDGGDPACDHAVGNQVQDNKAPGAISSGVRPGVDASVCKKCGARRIDQQIGLEDTPAAYIARLIDVFREVKRVLRADGNLYVNLGDSYVGYKGANYNRNGTRGTGELSAVPSAHEIGTPYTTGLPPKSLMLIPHRFAIAMQDDGWICREDICWSKPNPMPESVKDRCTRAHEYIFHFTKQPRYWYDAQAVAEEAVSTARPESSRWHEGTKQGQIGQGKGGTLGWNRPELGRNRRSVWTINPANFADAHFATFPEDIPEIIIQAACPEWCCEACGAPYEAVTEDPYAGKKGSMDAGAADPQGVGQLRDSNGRIHWGDNHPNKSMKWWTTRTTTGYAPSCACDAGKTAGVVLDPFMGAGTVGLVAKRLNRRYLGCDLNAEYVRMAEVRIDSIPYTLFSLMEVTP